LIKSNVPLSTSQTISHFVNHIANDKDKVQIDYLVVLAGLNLFVQVDRVVSFMPVILDFFY
jgi:hypothetical protein